jgi:hypothetical protein
VAIGLGNAKPRGNTQLFSSHGKFNQVTVSLDIDRPFGRSLQSALTLTECSRIKLIEFTRNHQTREIVSRTRCEIPVGDDHYDFDYDDGLG